MRAVWTILILASIALVAVADDAPSNISWEADATIFPHEWTRPPFLGQAAAIDAAEKPRAERLVSGSWYVFGVHTTRGIIDCLWRFLSHSGVKIESPLVVSLSGVSAEI